MAGRFEPKVPVELAPPKDDPITLEELAKADGSDPNGKTYVAIKGIVYDVTGNKAYQPGGSYNVFAGKDASRALGMTSTKAEDVSPEWQDLPDKEKGVLNDWITFFSKRYNVVGRVAGATNTE
ncbi:cytochrome b5-like Heme/Steroid binding domain-containing protein [Colletotrichum caudatum]|uniref:Cytochrome b5-like Heme/Steroid binding domain-containing protein n=1 Tax=Colletotrichum zoysiae TaxID=1216348 RepID=A0AAD9M603_9PEZI|nr:cytochrome b5-like Heme/Steroid binding domain-containing protein [Colletotrichum zoysiae]KAK2038099.1 cytochrome b5-like Heme/Steroid binding domain-containing protein [Colletotrichum somersetense]KAK2065195.1 cytochrome b5-like Heme/Steroid binding domain-containing protein [Colletotrichum caudatum]